MSAANSTPSAKSDKPNKPSPDFPLTPHPSGQWCKKIRGQLRYFGKWDDPDVALRLYESQKDALHSGRPPRADPGALTVKDLCNAFLNSKAAKRDSRELSPLTWGKYKRTCDLLVARFGKTRLVDDLHSDDFDALRNQMAKSCGFLRLADEIQIVRSVFKYGFDKKLMKIPMHFGPDFAKPSKSVMRRHRANQIQKLFTSAQIRAMIRFAGQPLKAMILLGVNCGFGNSDVGNLPMKAINLATGWVSFPRPKTGQPRRCLLWPETVAAIRDALAARPEPKDPEAADLVFITRRGNSWHKQVEDEPVSKEMTKLLKRLKLYRANGLSFYTFRHVFETIGGESKDQVAVNYLMGHARDSMEERCREKISDERLQAVTDCVRRWLFG